VQGHQAAGRPGRGPRTPSPPGTEQHQAHQAHQEANRTCWPASVSCCACGGWRNRAEARAVELLQPGWSQELGKRPATIKGGRAWDRAVDQAQQHRRGVDLADRADLKQRVGGRLHTGALVQHPVASAVTSPSASTASDAPGTAGRRASSSKRGCQPARSIARTIPASLFDESPAGRLQARFNTASAQSLRSPSQFGD